MVGICYLRFVKEYTLFQLITVIISLRYIILIVGCLRHWGQVHNQDIGAAKRALPRTLSKKIQDVKRKLHLPH